MKKKLLCAVIAAIMTASLAACGSKPAEAPAAPAEEKEEAAEEKEEAAGPSIALKFAYDDAETQPYYLGIAAFKEEVEAKTNGAITVDIYPNASLGNARDTIEGLSLGTVDCVFASTAALAQFVPDFAVMDAPFLFDDAEHADTCVDGELGEILSKAAEEKQNIHMLGFMDTGFRHLFSTKQVKTLDDFKGLKIRTMESEIPQAEFNALGAIATPMASSEVFTALQQGTIDAAENSFSYILNKKMYENAPYVTKTGHSYAFACIMISGNVYNQLTDEQKQIIDDAGATAIKVERDAVDSMNNDCEKQLKDDFGVTIDDIDRGALREAVLPLYDKYADSINPEYVEIVNSYRK